MAGYSWPDGKSNNAVAAEADGKMVASKFAAWVRRWRRFRGCTAKDVAAALNPCEWHHSSKFYNAVNYYDPRSLLYQESRDDLARVIAERKEFERLLRQYGEDSAAGRRFAVLTEGGKLWHHVYIDDGPRYLARMKQTVERGYASV